MATVTIVRNEDLYITVEINLNTNTITSAIDENGAPVQLFLTEQKEALALAEGGYDETGR